MLASQAQVGLDPLLPGVQVLLHFTRKYLAELGIDPADVRSQCLHQRQNHNHSNGERAHARPRAARAAPFSFGRALATTLRAPFLRLFTVARVGRLDLSIRPDGSPRRARSNRSRRAIFPSSIS